MPTSFQSVIQFMLGVVFGYSCLAKAKDPARFADGVADYDLVPEGTPSRVIAIVVIVSEAVVAASHLSGAWLNVGSPLTIVICIVFAAAVGINLRRGRELPCLCFGGRAEATISYATVYRLALLLCGELILLSGGEAYLSGTFTVWLTSPTVSVFSGLVVWSVVVGAAALWSARVPDVLKLVRPCASCQAARTALALAQAKERANG